MIQAIPTTYAGTTFRSRLEADYAATFDDIKLSWQYEPEGFQLSDGTWYSPDFYLPSARAWLEVKGDHQERVSKVEQFAAELWEAAGQPEYNSPNAPMVILAQSPRRHFINPNSQRPTFIGIRGLGKGCSVALARCPECRQVTFLSLWSGLCRACGYLYADASDAWHSSVCDYYMTKFVRLPRPAGRTH